MGVILATILTIGVFIASIKILKRYKFNTKSMAIVGIITAVTILLNMVKLVPFPQGGGFSEDIDEIEEDKLTNIFLKACEYEMKFGGMSYE